MRRSLYTDGEMSAGVFDDDGSDKNFAERYRTTLWAEHCGITEPSKFGDLRNVDYALGFLERCLDCAPPWSLPAVKLLPIYQRKQIPFKVGGDDGWPTVDMYYEDSAHFAEYDQRDPDSRDTF